MEDFGFALQYLVHQLKDNLFLIGGQYQVPVFKGKVPPELIDAMHYDTVDKRVARQPIKIIRRMHDTGAI